jgi:AraC family transcriptional regulator, positive regulator of tynA and feaB
MEQPNGDESLSLDLSAVGAPQRVSAFRDWMRASFPEFSLESMISSADGSARALSLGNARLWSIRCPAGLTIRAAPAAHFRRDAFVSFQLEGSRRVVRDGGSYRVEAGEVCLGRASFEGAETTFETRTTMLLLELPSRAVTRRHPQLGGQRFQVCRADRPGVILLHNLLASTMSVGERLEERERRIALASAIELLALPVVGPRSSETHLLRVERTLSVIDDRLGDPRLSAEMLAREQGISRRRLDELFVSALGSSVAACIAQRRLGRAAELLTDPTCSGLSVATVAEHVGFHDPSHFARAFKTRFGASPKRWRTGDILRKA